MAIRNLKKRLFLKLTLLLAFGALLYGCGFHLRGWNQGLPKFMQKVSIEYQGKDFAFLNRLSASITATGAEVVKSAEDADVILAIKNAASSSSLVGITGGASANQYMLSYTVSYQILNRQKQVILKDQINSASQRYNSNATQQLSSNAEQQQLIGDLQTQVANNIVLQMQSISKSEYQPAKKDKASV